MWMAVMSAEQVAALFVFAVVTSITPGPNNIMLAATGANVGIRRGLPHLLGVNLGFSLMLFLVAAGAGTAVLANPSLLHVLRFIGIAVLLWLAWKIATAVRTKGARARPIGFIEAAGFQWVNPKAWLMCAAAVSGFLQEDASALLQAGIIAGVFMIAGPPSSMAWLGFGAAMQHVLRTDRALRVFNVTMGLLLAATVLILV